MAFLIGGLAVFRYRQQVEQDDGFLAILVYNLSAKFGGKKDDGAAHPDSDGGDSPLAKGGYWADFWAPAVRKFGIAATEGPYAVFKVCTIFIFIPVFWAIFDQHGSTWILQAKSMDTTLFGIKVQPEQIAAWNPLMVMVLIPIMNLVYKVSGNLGFEWKPLRRMVIGLFMAGGSFAIAAIAQEMIDAAGPGKVSVWWQVLAYLVLTTSEVLVSITALEFAYTQAPKRMKSVVMGLFLLTVTLGNTFVTLLTSAKDMMAGMVGGEFGQAQFFWFFCWAAVIVGAMMAVRVRFYVQRDYTQD